MSYAIVADHASKCIRGRVVLDDVCLELPVGGIYGFSGINGSGKTMLLRAICGLVFLTSGSISVFGERVGVDVDFPRNMGVAFDSVGFCDERSGLQNLLDLASIKGKAGECDLRESLVRVGLDPDDTRPFSAYSMGMRKRLTIAQAIMESPNLLVLDEPSNALDVNGVGMLAKLMNEERERDCTVLVACHNEPAIEALFDQRFQMADGRISESGGGAYA